MLKRMHRGRKRTGTYIIISMDDTVKSATNMELLDNWYEYL